MTEATQRTCFAVLVDNEPGVLARVIGLFSGRGYNIESLTVDEIDRTAHISRITIVTNGPPMVIEQIKAQLGRLIPVRHVVNLTLQGKFVESCTAFIKLVTSPDKQAEAAMVAGKFGAVHADTSGKATIFSITDTPQKIDQMIQQFKPFGTVEIARTGSVAIACGEDILSIPPALAEYKTA